MKKLGLLAASISLVALSAQSHATPEEKSELSTKYELGIYLNLGGDELAKVAFEDGSNSTVNAGGGAHFVFGVRQPIDNNYSVVGRIGYLIDGVKSEDRLGNELDISFSSVTLDALGSYSINKHELAGGITYQPSPGYEVDYAGVSYEAEADSAFGLLLEYRYQVSDLLAADIRYTNIEYSIDDETYNGSGLGFGLAMTF